MATLCLGMGKGKKVDGHKHIGRVPSLSSFSGCLYCSYNIFRHKYLVPVVSLQLEDVFFKVMNLSLASYLLKKR